MTTQSCQFSQTSRNTLDLDCGDNTPTSSVVTTAQEAVSQYAPYIHGGEWAIGIIALLIFLFSVIFVADQWERFVILRLGKFRDIRGPGLFFKWPFIERAIYTSVQLEVKNIKAEKTMTKDSVPVDVKAIIQWQVTDPRAAVIEIDDYADSISSITQTMLREVIGSCNFTELLSNRESVDTKIQESVARKITGWGVTVKAIDIQDIQIPDALQDGMSREAQAERERHARVILGQSEVDIATQLVAAAKIYESDPVAIQLRAMNIVYETTKERGSTILIPTDMASAMSGLLTAKKV